MSAKYPLLDTTGGAINLIYVVKQLQTMKVTTQGTRLHGRKELCGPRGTLVVAPGVRSSLCVREAEGAVSGTLSGSRDGVSWAQS